LVPNQTSLNEHYTIVDGADVFLRAHLKKALAEAKKKYPSAEFELYGE